jgi:Tfp pilus assembly protein PilO
MKVIPMKIGSIPGRSMMYLLLCVVILVIVYFAALYPYQRSLEALDAKTAQVTKLIQKQKTLLPLFEAMVKRGKARKGTLPVPDMKALSRGDIGAVSPLFKRMADENGMRVVFIRPDVLTLTEESRDMVVTMHLEGGFFDFRKFLVGVGGVPSLRRVEEIEMRQETGHKQFYLRVRLAIG